MQIRQVLSFIIYRAIFSRIVIDGQVPIAGFLINTSNLSLSIYSFDIEISSPFKIIFLLPLLKLPQIRFNMDVFPEPLLLITMKSSSTVRLSLWIGRLHWLFRYYNICRYVLIQSCLFTFLRSILMIRMIRNWMNCCDQF